MSSTPTAKLSTRQLKILRLGQFVRLVRKLIAVHYSHIGNKDIEYRRTIFYELAQWGGVYIKFLQIVAGMSKFMEGWGGPAEMAIFSQAPLEELELSQYINLDDYATISATPVAAGSFALVYRGQLKTGEDVAVKILRPSIANNLARELKMIRKLCRFLTRFLPKYLIDYNDAYDVCARMFLTETNYANERANQQYFYDLYQDNPRVAIPKVYEQYSNARVIVQEFIDGPTLSDVMRKATPQCNATELTKKLTGSDLWEQVMLAGGEALYMAMCADYVFGDPHPGNIVLLPDNRIAFIDFGVVAAKPASHHAFANWVESYAEVLRGSNSMTKLLEATVTCFTPDLALAMRQMIFADGDLLQILAKSMDEKLHQEMKDNQDYVTLFANGHLMDVFLRVVSAKIIEVDVNEVNFELLKAMQAFLGSVTILDNAEARSGFSNIMQQSVEYALAAAHHAGIAHDSVTTTRRSLTESYELVIDTLSSIASADEFMFDLVRERIFA